MSENNSNINHEKIDTKEIIKKENDELTERINRLYGISTKEEPHKEYDPNELQEIRKKLLYLLIGVITAGVIVLIVLINPFKINDKKLDETPVNDKVDDNSEDALGELSLTDSTVVELNSRMSFYETDFMKIDLYPLYLNQTLNSNDISDDIKLYLLKRTVSFSEMLKNSGVEEYVTTCDEKGIEISKEVFDKEMQLLFGANTTINYKNLNYTYYNASQTPKKLLLTFENDKYRVTCNEYSESGELSKLIQQKLIKAYKTIDGIELYQRVVFITREGVFMDPKFETLITNDPDATISTYIDKGNIYKYTFIKDENNNYSLNKIEVTDGVSQ